MRTSFLILGCLFFLFLAPLVVAETDWDSFSSGSIDWVGEKIGFLFGEKDVATQTLFAILLFMILYPLIGSIFKSNNFFKFIISGAITALALIALPSNFLSSIRDQYGAMGATVLAIIPFIIMLVFTVRVESELVGRVIWIFYALYYFAIFVYSAVAGGQSFFSSENIPNFVAILAGIALFFGVPIIREAMFKGKLKELKREGASVALRSKMLHTLQKEELEAYDIKNK